MVTTDRLLNQSSCEHYSFGRIACSRQVGYKNLQFRQRRVILLQSFGESAKSRINPRFENSCSRCHFYPELPLHSVKCLNTDTMMKINAEAGFHKHSLLNVMNRFLTAANNMDETIMVPSLLRDVPLQEQEEDTSMHNNSDLSFPSKQRDMYEHYMLLKSIKNEMEWGLLKRDLCGDTSFLEITVKQEKQQVPDGPTEDNTDLESQFHFHLRGLFGILSKLADQADNLTNRYKREIGGGSLL